jgi:hypothetical protein
MLKRRKRVIQDRMLAISFKETDPLEGFVLLTDAKNGPFMPRAT